MRPGILLLLLMLSLAPTAPAQSKHSATLDIEIDDRHAELMTLTLAGLDRLTRYHGICLPERAQELRVYDELGDVSYEVSEENERRAIAFTARSTTVHVDMSRSAAASPEHPLYSRDVNFCVPDGSFVRVNVAVPEGHTLFFLSDDGEIEDARRGTTTSDGPTHVFYSYEAPLASNDLVVFQEGPFRALVKPELEQAARVAIGHAADPFEAAIAEAGLDAPFDAMRVRFVSETPFTWEAGHYNGQGYVTVKETALDDDPNTGFPYAPVKVIVHESFHAASFPYGKGQVTDHVSWFLEGSARHAERQVDRSMPNATIRCERDVTEVKCLSFDDRIARADLDTGYASTFTFDTRWEPSLEQSEATRRFYYGYSEFVVGAWIEQKGAPAYRGVWDRIEAAFEEGEGCPCGEGWLLSLLGEKDDVLRPWNDVRTSDPAGFEARVLPFVKDEDALEEALNREANPLSGLGVPAPAYVGAGALALAAMLARRRARAR